MKTTIECLAKVLSKYSPETEIEIKLPKLKRKRKSRAISGYCIYIGKNFKPKRECEVELNYGMTGHAFYDHTSNRYDFRLDGLNIAHMVNKKDLLFTIIDKD